MDKHFNRYREAPCPFCLEDGVNEVARKLVAYVIEDNYNHSAEVIKLDDEQWECLWCGSRNFTPEQVKQMTTVAVEVTEEYEER